MNRQLKRQQPHRVLYSEKARVWFLLTIIILISSCRSAEIAPTTQPSATSTLVPIPTGATSESDQWAIYDPDPHHLWNRLFRQLYQRPAEDGQDYGHDTLDPLLWLDTGHLLVGDSHEQALHVLDEFLASGGEELITDPLKRAMFQRDLWAVFDWLTVQLDEADAPQRQALQIRCVPARRSALRRHPRHLYGLSPGRRRPDREPAE